MEQPTHPTQQNNIVIIGKAKSVGTAFLLSFLFGPLGLLYASVIGGIVMFILGMLLFFLLPVVGMFLTWIGAIIWAVVAANMANAKLHDQAKPLIQNQTITK